MSGDAGEQERSRVVPGSESDNIIVDPEFRGWMLPHSPAELARLHRRLDLEDCRDALIVWKGHNALVDGHNRLAYCRAMGYPFWVIEKEFADREAVKAYIEEIQRAQRNLSDLTVDYYIGKRYLEMKRQGKRTDLTSGQSDQKTTAEQLEEECQKSPTTICRDARLFRAVEEVAGNCGVEARNLVLARNTELSRKYIGDLAKFPPEEQQKVIEDLKNGEKPCLAAEDKPKTMVVPMQPEPLAETLLKKLDPKAIDVVIEALVAGNIPEDKEATMA